MREILFRGKREDNGEWVEGYLVKHFEKCYIYYEEPDEMCQVGTWICGAEVIPKTVGQYTGLTDKNGTKIFEGDILEITSEYYSRKEKSLYKVKYHEATASWCAFAIDFIQRVPLCKNECKYYKVIGNIHDNPELLKGGAE